MPATIEAVNDFTRAVIPSSEEQLGLKLEPTSTLQETVVIEHAEKPSEN
jgi:uncharacterized protein (TIGR03435 family)